MKFAAPLNVEVEEGKAGDGAPAAGPPLLVWQLGNAVMYFLALYFVSLGGRLDDSQGNTTTNYLAPSGYAFIIWPIIFLLELITVVWQLLQWPQLSCATKDLATLRAFSPAFCAGQLFMLLWCFTYVESFNSVGLLWISAAMLSGIAISLSFAHRAAVAAQGTQELLFLYPGMTLHFGWTTAAALLNWNGWLAIATDSVGVKLVALLASLVAAMAIGMTVGIGRNSLLYAGTICWALVAIGVNTLTNAEGLVRDLGQTVVTILGVVEIVAGMNIVGVTLISKGKRLQEARSVG